jgi:fructose-specific phosphotransferase system IIC component
MAQRQQPPWWWRSEVLGQVAMALLAAVAAAYLARLLMSYL